MQVENGAALSEDQPLVPLARAQREPWARFLAVMFRVGLNSFGGPVAQIGVMHEELVERRAWVTDGQFARLLGFANILPGPEALELVIHIGYLRRGMLGGIAAGLLFIWPGFVSLTALAWLYASYGQLAMMAAVMDGIRPVAVALIAAAVLRLAARSLVGGAAYAIAAAAFGASYGLGAPFIVILLGGGLAGLFEGWRARGEAPRPAAVSQAAARLRACLLVATLATTAVVGLTAAPAAPLRTRPSTSHQQAPLLEIALVNTKTALMTFGGAYTAFPYMREQFVERHRWLDDADVLTALALGETTPGPLITVGVFLSHLAAGFSGAVVGGIFLFLPSFVLVLGLGRFLHRVERIRGARLFVSGVSAATIGLILALASAVIPQSIHDLFGLAAAALAFVAVARFKVSVLLLVAAGALLGLVRAYMA